jgi:hypothetical protein
LTPTIPQQSTREVREFENVVLVADYSLLAITYLGFSLGRYHSPFLLHHPFPLHLRQIHPDLHIQADLETRGPFNEGQQYWCNNWRFDWKRKQANWKRGRKQKRTFGGIHDAWIQEY